MILLAGVRPSYVFSSLCIWQRRCGSALVCHVASAPLPQLALKNKRKIKVLINRHIYYWPFSINAGFQYTEAKQTM